MFEGWEDGGLEQRWTRLGKPVGNTNQGIDDGLTPRVRRSKWEPGRKREPAD